MSRLDPSNIIISQGRIPHFHKKFPLILFWSQKVAALPLHIGLFIKLIS